MYASSELEYKGWYWSTGNGKYYTGQTPQSSQILELVKMVQVGSDLGFDNEPLYTNKIKVALAGDAPDDQYSPFPYNSDEIIKYSYIKNKPLIPDGTKILPQYNPILPTQQDYQNGEFRRYFCKRTNLIQYLEISQSTYNQIKQKNPTIEWTLYFSFFIDWQLTGNKDQVAKTNRNVVLYQMKKFNLYKLDEYLKFDFTKYYQ